MPVLENQFNDKIMKQITMIKHIAPAKIKAFAKFLTLN